MHNRQKLGLLIGALFLISFLVYAGFEAKKLFLGPQITIATPFDGQTFDNQSAVTVSGIALNAAFLTLDGRQIFTDSTGNWSETLVLLPGYNIITADARDRYGKEDTKTLHLYLIEATRTVPSLFPSASSTTTGQGKNKGVGTSSAVSASTSAATTTTN